MDEAFEPADVPALRRDLLDWLRDGRGLTFHATQSVDAGTRIGRPEYNGHPAVMRAYAETLCAHEFRALRSAELFFVTAEMTAIVQAAAEQMPPFAPSADDFPATSGLVVFETPLVSYRRPEDRVGVVVNRRLAVDFRDRPYEDIAITACTWGPYDGDGSWEHGGVLMSFYRDRRHMLASLLDDELRASLRGTLARLVPDNECGIGFQIDDIEERLREHDDPAYTTYWAKYLLATLLLMRQPLVYQRSEPTRRGLRRQLERAGLPTGDIQVLDVRPRRYTTVPQADEGAAAGEARDADGNGRSVSVRFPVAGHWRRHWYPKRGVHRPKWIEEHWRGPEDAPIVHAERVRVLRNHPGQTPEPAGEAG